MSRHRAARSLLTVLTLTAAAGCTAGGADQSAPESSVEAEDTQEAEDAEPTDEAAAPEPEEPESSEASGEQVARAPGEICRLAAPTIETELRRWADADDVTQAPIGKELLGPQLADGVPGVLTDGCVWEVRGRTGGHIGVAVEQFTEVDMAAIETMGRDAGVEPTESAEGTRTWHVPPSGGTPSGAVLVGDSDHLVVVRVESYSETDSGTVLGDDERADRFFRVVGDAIQDVQPD